MVAKCASHVGRPYAEKTPRFDAASRRIRQLAAGERTAAIGLAMPVPGSFQPSAFSFQPDYKIADR
jgi:hypothetical protein